MYAKKAIFFYIVISKDGLQIDTLLIVVNYIIILKLKIDEKRLTICRVVN